VDASGRSARGDRFAGAPNARRAVKQAAHWHDALIPPRHGVVVLCYHRVGERSAATEVDLPEATFRRQMEAVTERGAQTIDAALVALRSARPPREDRVVVTFDDGTADFVDVALPVLVEHSVPAVLYVATEFIELQREFPGGGKPLSWGAIEDAISTGLITIGSHSHTHALFDRIDAATAADEVQRSVELLFARVGVLAEHFAYPKALLGSAEVERVVRDHFTTAAIAGTRANSYGETNRYRLARSPVQRSDGMFWFERKLEGGLRFEDDLRRIANRVRYLGATT
jgi:peptidoglycan/xylan/chitin deacetylase (PgdA/CDA1 family)